MTLYVVTGPPCAGKSTWVRERAQIGDIVVDLDRIALAITAEQTHHHAYPVHIRKAAIVVRKTAVAVAIAYSRTGTSFIIHAKPNPRALREHARVCGQIIALDAPFDVLMARAKAERPPEIVRTLAHWWDQDEE